MTDEIKLSESELAYELSGPEVEPAADERPGAVHPTFAAECAASIKTLPMSEHWILGPEFVTHSDLWGDIWRVDFEILGQSVVPRINRLVSWRRDNGTLPIIIAIGQDVPPLVIDGK